MEYFKVCDNTGHIIFIGRGRGSQRITPEEYGDILAALKVAPTVPEGYRCALADGTLTWELQLLPPAPAEDDSDEISDAEAAEILLGGDAL